MQLLNPLDCFKRLALCRRVPEKTFEVIRTDSVYYVTRGGWKRCCNARVHGVCLGIVRIVVMQDAIRNIKSVEHPLESRYVVFAIAVNKGYLATQALVSCKHARDVSGSFNCSNGTEFLEQHNVLREKQLVDRRVKSSDRLQLFPLTHVTWIREQVLGHLIT